jgi:hypothetical protein
VGGGALGFSPVQPRRRARSSRASTSRPVVSFCYSLGEAAAGCGGGRRARGNGGARGGGTAGFGGGSRMSSDWDRRERR